MGTGFFSGKLVESGFKRSKLYNWLLPKTSGNTINGLGEEERVRPRPIMWHNLPRIKHWAIQLLFKFKFRPRMIVQHSSISRDFIRLKIAKRMLKKQVPKVDPKSISPPDSYRELKELSLELGAKDVGVTKVKPEWIFQGYELPDWASAAMKKDELYLFMFLVQHDPECFDQAPAWAFSKEIANKYNHGSDVAVALCKKILSWGCHAYGHGGPEAGEILLTPAAIDAGLGELGKHGSLIHPTLGPNFRIGCVYTTLPIQRDQPKVFGVDDFCTRCQVCTKACPPNAISDGKKMVRGEEKFYVDFDKCMPFMTDNFGCGVCLTVCPWAKEDVAFNLMKKFEQRTEKVQIA